MSTEAFNYSSVHDFLDEVLGEHPSHLEIKEAKRAYWKKYNAHLKRERRKILKCVHLSLSKKEHSEIKLLAQNSGVSMYQYIRSVCLNPQPFRIPCTTINKLEAICLKLYDLQQEMEEEEVPTEFFWERVKVEYQKLHTEIVNLKTS